MDILSRLLDLPFFLQLLGWQLYEDTHRFVVTIASTRGSVPCPICRTPSHHVHSHYERALADISLAEYRVIWNLWARKFFCRNPDCPRRVFNERFPEIIAPRARKTERLIRYFTDLGLALGGEAGKQAGECLNLPVSGSTMEAVRPSPTPTRSHRPKVLGVDDWAWRKGRRYGTILVEIVTHRPIALLADRSAKTLAAWLTQHPGVEIVTRDRSKVYRQGIRDGAPDALQVADRFHLLLNLSEALEKVFSQHLPDLKTVEISLADDALLAALPPADKSVLVPPESDSLPSPLCPESTPVAGASKTAIDKSRARSEHYRSERLRKFEMIWQLKRQGLSYKAIARRVGAGEKTVQRFSRSPVFPERQPRSDRGKTTIEPYIPYLLQRLNAGFVNARILFAELQELGYTGSYMTLTRYLHPLRGDGKPLPRQPRRGRSPLATVVIPRSPPLTPRRAVSSVLQRPDRLKDKDKEIIERLQQQDAELNLAISLARDFASLVRQRIPEKLDPPIERALASSLSPIVNFARGLLDDYSAVRAGVTLPWSNGPVEGLIDRLKMLERQMYGRAGIDLLRRRFLLAR